MEEGGLGGKEVGYGVTLSQGRGGGKFRGKCIGTKEKGKDGSGGRWGKKIMGREFEEKMTGGKGQGRVD